MVVKKKAVNPEFKKALKVFIEQTKARERIAKLAYDAQDNTTKEVLENIRDRIVSYSSGVIRISLNGRKGAYKDVQIDAELVHANALYMATEILKDLALLDVKIANYKFPQMVCTECGEILTPKKKGKRRG